MVFLNQYKDKVVYGAKNIFGDYYSGSGGSVHYIGLSSKLKTNEKIVLILFQRIQKLMKKYI